MSTKEISAAAQALGRRGGLKSLGAKSKAELSAFGKAAAQKRWAAFARGEQSGEAHTVGGMFSAGAQQLEALAGVKVKPEHRCYVCLDVARVVSPEYLMTLQTTPECVVTIEADKVTGGMCSGMTLRPREQAPKPKRPLPKAGTVNALVLAAMSVKPMSVDAIYERAADVYGYERVRNALSSLRSAGHVVSEPKPGSRKEKLWRLA